MVTCDSTIHRTPMRERGPITTTGPMLKAPYRAPNQTITATELATAAGYKSYSAANLQYGNVGKALYEELPVEIPAREDGSLIYTSALATAGEKTEAEVHWAWKLRPEVAYAIEHLGLAA